MIEAERLTRRYGDFVAAAVKQIAETGAHIGGIVLSQVDIRKQNRYGYATSNYYDNPNYFSD